MTPHELHGPFESGRDGWRHAMLALVTPALRRAAQGPLRQPSTPSSNDPGATWLELIARPLWGLAADAAGRTSSGASGRASSGTGPLWTIVRDTLARAFGPQDPWYVGLPQDRNQRLVESAALGFALDVAPHEMWEPLSDRQRHHLGTWLRAAAEAEPVDNNWHYFPVFAGRGLDRVGFTRTSRDAEHLARLESFALADGWFQDGETQRCDYYVPFGFHWYSLLLNTHDSARVTRFAEQFRHWFAADGSAVPFGRSLGYRFAQGAFWGALACADLEAVPWAQSRALAEGNLRWWWSQPIVDSDGLLEVGYAYPNTALVESYLATGSTYWATKFFAPLMLPTDHPFWTATPALPPYTQVASQPAPRAVLIRTDDVILLNGQGWADWAAGGTAKYAKFAYSTRAGFSIARGDHDLAHGAFDSTLALSDDEGSHWRPRTAVDESRVDGQTVYSRWHPWPDVQVETWLLPYTGPWHLRLHRITSPRPLLSAEGGFCAPHLPRISGASGPAAARQARGWASCRGTAIADPSGTRTGEIILPLAGTNVLHPRTVLPMLRGTHGPGESTLITLVK